MKLESGMTSVCSQNSLNTVMHPINVFIMCLVTYFGHEYFKNDGTPGLLFCPPTFLILLTWNPIATPNLIVLSGNVQGFANP